MKKYMIKISKKIGLYREGRVLYNTTRSIRNATILLWKDKRVIWNIFKKFGFKKVKNFVFVKLYVPGERVGEGIQHALYLYNPKSVPYPYRIEVEITTKCPFNCIMCEKSYWNEYEPQVNKDLTIEEFKTIINSFPKLKYINVTGEGSSFLNKDFSKMLNYLSSKNIFTVVIDSFAAISGRHMKHIIEIGIPRLWISIDAASKNTYEKIRVGANFDKVINNIKRFLLLKKEAGSLIPEIGFRYTFMKPNYQEMSDFLDLIHEICGKECYIEFVGLLEFEQTKDLVYEPPDELIEELKQKAKKYGIPLLYSHPEHLPEKMNPIDICLSWAEPYIMMGGYVLSCCSVLMSNRREFLRQNSFGNIYKTPFEEIWKSSRYTMFRRMINTATGQVPILCHGCRGFTTKYREEKFGVSKDI